MVLSMPKPSGNAVRFTAGPPVRSWFPPPTKPPDDLGYGESCFMASCMLQDSRQVDILRIYGYDTTLNVIEDVENACRVRSRKHPNSTCGETKLTFLPPSRYRECSGLYFEFVQDKKTIKIH